MRKFITTIAVSLVALVSVGAASAHNGDGPKTQPTKTFCIGGQTTVVTGALPILLDTLAADNGGVLYGIEFLNVPPYIVLTQTPIQEGACVVAVAQVDRGGACTVNGNVFVDVTNDELVAGVDSAGDKIVPSDFVQGVGLTCNAVGYTAAGYVSGDGTVDTAAPQFNIYPYYVTA